LLKTEMRQGAEWFEATEPLQPPDFGSFEIEAQ
jgi:hypothetical protein